MKSRNRSGAGSRDLSKSPTWPQNPSAMISRSARKVPHSFHRRESPGPSVRLLILGHEHVLLLHIIPPPKDSNLSL